MPQLCKDEYQARRWSNNPRRTWEKSYESPRDEENCPPNLDFRVIEQIADGVEKMILAWNHGEDRAAYAPKSSATNSGLSSPATISKGAKKAKQIKSPLSEMSSFGDAACNFVCSATAQATSGSTGEFGPALGICQGIGSAMGGIVSQVVKRATSNKDARDANARTETSTSWYMEASDVTKQGHRGCSKDTEATTVVRSGRSAGSPNNAVQSPEKSDLEAKCWSKEDKSSSRSDEGARLKSSAPASDYSSVHPGSKQSKRKPVSVPPSNAPSAAEESLPSTKQTTQSSTPVNSPQSGQPYADPPIKGAGEVPRLPEVHVGRGNSGGLDSQFGSVIIDDELLERKLAALTTMPPTPLNILEVKGKGGRTAEKMNEKLPIERVQDDVSAKSDEKGSSRRTEGEDILDERSLRQCQDLQIALLECAMEYEIKTIELKMKLKSLQSTPKHSDDSKSGSAEVESMKRQLFKLQREKGAVTKEYLSLKKKERKFELHRRNLDDALLRVNRLQKELVRKDQELLDSQLMEKHIQVKLQEAETLARARSDRVEPSARIEPAKVVALLPSLREWVKTLTRDQTHDPPVIKLRDIGYRLPNEQKQTEPLRQRSANEKLQQSSGQSDSQKLFETVVQSLVKEVQALQRELGKLGPRTWKQKKTLLSNGPNGLEDRQSGKPVPGAAASSLNKVKRFYNR